MDSIALNFVPLLEQGNNVTVYRNPVPDNSQLKKATDFRTKLPEQDNSDEWSLFDISITKQDGYEAYEYEYSQNPVLTVYLIYQELLDILESKTGEKTGELEYYIPEKAIMLKEVRFVTVKFDEGNTEVIVKPYYLKAKKQFGLLVEHKFSHKEGQPFNRQTLIRSFSLDRFGKPNIYFYKDKKSVIETFLKDILSPALSGSSLDFDANFSVLPTKQLDVKTYLVGSGKTAKSQFMGIRSNGPYRQMDDGVRYLFLFTERTRSLARDIYLGLVGKLFPSQFSGLEQMFSVPIHKDIVEHHLVSTFDAAAIQSIEGRIQQLKASYPADKVMLVAVLPKGFKGVDSDFDAYGNLKLMALRNNAYCQVVTEDTFFKKDQLKWSVSNIGLQMFSKFGGAPWLVQPAKNDCLIFGIGSVQEKNQDSVTRYTAYTVCLDSSGDFKYIKPLSSSSDEAVYLDNLKANLKDVLSSELGEHYKSLVLHLPYKISRKEIEAIKAVASQIRKADEFEVIVIRVNTKHKFLGFSDHNTCVPYESTYVQLSANEFLIWAEGLQHGKEVLHKRVSEPLYIDFIESQEEWVTKKECLQDILNLTGANWRGFNSKAQPISILYSRLIAKFMKEFSHFENVNDMSIVSAESVAPWFL
ncbi:MAG: Piwi domain-containing protein [Gammaproteobacteria bacterium]|nr:Piwi domain-containing protein [Gammaproteobacteria bacterium]